MQHCQHLMQLITATSNTSLYDFLTDFYDQVLSFTQEYFEHGIMRVWIGPRPSIAVYHADTSEVYDLFYPLYQITTLK